MRFFKDAAVTVAAIALTLFALEIAFRLADLRFEASLYTEEQERGYASRPNAEGWSTLENNVYVRINSDGMRDRERSLTAPQNVLRIAVIGSSEADARQVPLGDTFEAVMERRLSGILKPKCSNVEVLNFGVPGYGLSQEYLTLRNHVWKYHPQIVMLATTANVMIRNTRNLYREPTKGTPFYVLEHGRLTPDVETRSAPPLNRKRVMWKDRFSDWMNRSELLMIANEALRIKGPEVIARIKSQFHPKASPAMQQPAREDKSAWTYLPDLPQMQESWQIGDAFFKAMKEECDRQGAEFWIVVIGMPVEVHPDLAVRAAYTKQLGVPALELSDKRITELANRDGIHTILLAPAMGAYAVSHYVALHGFPNTAFNDGHWNETGHRIAAGLITQELLRSSPVISKLR
jgi:hypothetical protein